MAITKLHRMQSVGGKTMVCWLANKIPDQIWEIFIFLDIWDSGSCIGKKQMFPFLLQARDVQLLGEVYLSSMDRIPTSLSLWKASL